MSLKMKLTTYATTAVVLVVLGLFYQVRDSDDDYVLSVTWKPGVLSREHPVYITATVDGVPLIKRTRHVSPWGETMTAVPGAAVVLTAMTAHIGAEILDCVIMVNNRQVPGSGYDSRTGPGSVKCTN